MDANKKELLPSKIISIFFHPVFMPVYGLGIILSDYTPFGFLQLPVKKLLLMIIIVNNVFLPFALMPVLMYMNFVNSWTMREREERVVPMIISTILYATSFYIFYKFPVPFFLKSFMFSIFLISLILTLINFRWKISLHSVASGSLAGLILYLSFRLNSDLLWMLVLVVIAGGMIMSARLRLDLHSPRQVWLGFSTGFVLFIFLIQFLQQFS